MKSHVTRSAEECQELTASRNFIRTNRFGSRITRRRRRRRHAVAWRLEFQGLFQVSNIEERHDIRQTWKSSHEPTPFFPLRKFPANRISLTDEGTLNRFRRLLVPLLEEYIDYFETRIERREDLNTFSKYFRNGANIRSKLILFPVLLFSSLEGIK